MSRRGTFGRDTGMNWLAGGAAAAILVPGLALGLGLPFWLALVVSGGACAGIVLALAPKARFEGLEGRGIARSKIELASELIEAAEPEVERLTAVAKTIRSRPVADRVEHLGRVADSILRAVETDPLKVDRVRRFITYYLPRAGEMAESYQLLETRPTPDTQRLASTGAIIDRLAVAFTRYADHIVDADLDTLDIELKLLQSALDDDLDRLQPKAPEHKAPEPKAPANNSRSP